jgi:hypothetical protein
MKTIRIALLSLAVAAVVTPVNDADARGRHGHRGHHHHHHRGSVGIFFGAPLFAPYYYSPYWYPRYYYPPAVVAAQPPVYIEQNSVGAAAPAPVQQGTYWYFCPDSQTYYPYVQSCTSPWQQVVPQVSAAPQ